MCKIDDYMYETSQYINAILDLKIDIKPVGKEGLNVFPANITASYGFYTAKLLGRDVILLYSADNFAYTPGQMRKQKELVEWKAQSPVIFVFSAMAAYNIQRLVKQRVNFIIPHKQMFMPDLLIDLKPQKKNIEINNEIQIPTIAQCIILYHLEVESLVGRSSYDIADVFKVSYANVNRAVRWLEKNKVISLSGSKTKNLVFHSEKRELWDMVLPLLVNPIERIVYTDMQPDKIFCISGVNALSEYSMLNKEKNGSYAIAKEEFRRLRIQTDKEYGENRIEVWRYNPKYLSKNGVVDKLSLFLTMRDVEDERIQIELEAMINNMVW